MTIPTIHAHNPALKSYVAPSLCSVFTSHANIDIICPSLKQASSILQMQQKMCIIHLHGKALYFKVSVLQV